MEFNDFKSLTMGVVDGTISKEDWQTEVIGYDKYSGDNLRRAFSFCKELIENIEGAELKIDLDIERRKKQNATRELNEKIRWLADKEYFIEVIQSAVENIKPVDIVLPARKETPFEHTGCLYLADAHYGAEFDIESNAYSPEIYKERMGRLISNIVNDPMLYTMKKLKIYCLGDCVENILRMSSLTKMKTPVMDCVMQFSEHMSAWLAKLYEKTGVEIEFNITGGNHDICRILQQKPSFEEENLCKIIRWYIASRLEDIDGITIMPYDNRIHDVIGDNVIVCTHEEKVSLQTFAYYEGLYGKVSRVICGHRHNYNVETLGTNFYGQERKIVHTPSIVGSDPYAESLRKDSRAGCYFELVDGKGNEIFNKIYWLN